MGSTVAIIRMWIASDEQAARRRHPRKQPGISSCCDERAESFEAESIARTAEKRRAPLVSQGRRQVTAVNKGPAITSTPNLSLLLGAPGSGGNSVGIFSSQITAIVPSPVDDYIPAGVSAGISNLWLMTPSIATTIVNGINTTGMAVGFSFLFLNQSASNSFQFNHLASTSLPQDQFSCPQGEAAILSPLTSTIIIFNGTNLVFGS